jgi:signal transduction histidine kinase
MTLARTSHFMFVPGKCVVAALLAICAVLITSPAAPAEPANEVLTNASDILALTPERAIGKVPVSIKGVVTVAEPSWQGRFFVQDASAGVFVNYTNGNRPSPGDLVSVTGETMPGGYAPCIDNPRWEKLGTAPWPTAKAPTIDSFMTGNVDSQFIEMSGIVRAAFTNWDRLGVQLETSGYRYRAFSPIPPGIDPNTLVGARVRVTGTAGVSFNPTLRHFLTIVIYAPVVSDFVVIEPAAANPFNGPLIPLNGIAQYQNKPSASHRIHVKGTVTYQRAGEDLFLQDDSGGLQVKSIQRISLAPGDVVEAVGFPGLQNFLPVLEDAILKKISGPQTNLVPSSVLVSDLQNGLSNATFITLNAKLLDRLTRGVKSWGADGNNTKTILVLQPSNLVFTAEKEAAAEDSFLTSIPIGSTLEVNGVCLLQTDEAGKTKSMQLLLPSSNAVRILAKPSWMTPQRLLAILAFSLVVILIGSTWIIMISRKNSALKELIQERELDRKELQKAHDTLEWRVKERTRQLKVQITARKEADLQSKAVLTERTRLAKELHDTIEQTMTGVTLQLNAVAKLLPQNPDTAGHHLGLARNMVRSSRVDLRRSIWDLRTRELEQFDLPTALLISGNQIADGAAIRVEIETEGEVRPLPEIIEENILRIGQEAMTNAAKHSGASYLLLHLAFRGEKIVLTVKDNGRGFTPETCAGPNEGHFGLLGMSERVKRLSGKISILSTPGEGTTICVEIPVKETALAKPAAVLVENTSDYEEDIPPDLDS